MRAAAFLLFGMLVIFSAPPVYAQDARAEVLRMAEQYVNLLDSKDYNGIWNMKSAEWQERHTRGGFIAELKEIYDTTTIFPQRSYVERLNRANTAAVTLSIYLMFSKDIVFMRCEKIYWVTENGGWRIDLESQQYDERCPG